MHCSTSCIPAVVRLCGEFDSLVNENWIMLVAIPFWYERPL